MVYLSLIFSLSYIKNAYILKVLFIFAKTFILQIMRKKFIIILWSLIGLGFLTIALIFTAIAKGWIGYVPPVEELENPSLKFATQIISDDGKLLGTWSYSKENRVYVGYNDLSLHLIHALIYQIIILDRLLVLF